jgi:hypothetical protein
MPAVPALRKQKQKGCEFQASLGLHSETLSHSKGKKKRKICLDIILNPLALKCSLGYYIDFHNYLTSWLREEQSLAGKTKQNKKKHLDADTAINGVIAVP